MKNELPSPRFRPGPALLVTAAFIGPGTVLMASKAGALYGTSLLWVVVFASLATIVFQEMAARIGVVFGDGLGQAIAKLIENRFLQVAVSGLVVVAILIGNAAYQTGNIKGAAKGVEILIQPDFDWKASLQPWVVGFIGAVAAGLILLNRFEWLQRALTVLVVLMSLLFLATACLTRPSISEIASGLIPNIPKGSAWILVGVLGTTVVPYNLFLHASLAARQWRDAKAGIDTDVAIRHARLDTILSVSLGGIVTSAILLTAANAFSKDGGEAGTAISDVKEIAIQLEPLLGNLSNWLFGIGLFAAGLTSAITAPVAGAYAAAGCFGWPNNLGDWRLRTVALSIIAAGVGVGIFIQKSPAEIIALAQVANGLLLPLLAVLLVVVANQAKLMGKQVNSRFVNVLAIGTIAVIFLVAILQLKKGFGL